MRQVTFKHILISALFLFACNLHAQEAPSPILFIYDASGSMWGELDGTTKKEIASDVLSTTVTGLPDDQTIGLIAYGHREKGDCNDIEFLVDLSNDSKDKIISSIQAIQPIGKTPLARSVAMAIHALEVNNIKATIILITDGIESCDGDLCQIVSDARDKGIEFKLHIVGFGLQEGEKEQLLCITKEGLGNYYDAYDTEALSQVLTEATTLTIDKPAGNLSIFAVKNGVPVDAWVRPVDVVTRQELNGARTYRDTARVYLPKGKYQVEVKPLENSDIPSTSLIIEIGEGEVQHHDVSFDGGIMQVTATNNGEPWDAIFKALDENSGKEISRTRTYGTTKQMEVPAGSYKITIQALKLEGRDIYYEMTDVEVRSNDTTPVVHDFESGIAMIGVRTTGGELIDATVNFFDESTGKNVAAARTYTSVNNNPKKFVLSPGTYRVKIVTLGQHSGHSDTFNITVKAKETIEKILTY